MPHKKDSFQFIDTRIVKKLDQCIDEAYEALGNAVVPGGKQHHILQEFLKYAERCILIDYSLTTDMSQVDPRVVGIFNRHTTDIIHEILEPQIHDALHHPGADGFMNCSDIFAGRSMVNIINLYVAMAPTRHRGRKTGR